MADIRESTWHEADEANVDPSPLGLPPNSQQTKFTVLHVRIRARSSLMEPQQCHVLEHWHSRCTELHMKYLLPVISRVKCTGGLPTQTNTAAPTLRINEVAMCRWCTTRMERH